MFGTYKSKTETCFRFLHLPTKILILPYRGAWILDVDCEPLDDITIGCGLWEGWAAREVVGTSSNGGTSTSLVHQFCHSWIKVHMAFYYFYFMHLNVAGFIFHQLASPLIV